MSRAIDRVTAAQWFAMRNRSAIGGESAGETKHYVGRRFPGCRVFNDKALVPSAQNRPIALVDRVPSQCKRPIGFWSVQRNVASEEVGIRGQVDRNSAVRVGTA